MHPREQEVLNHFLETGEPLKIHGLSVSDARVYCGIDSVGAWSDHTEPSIGWVPTKELLRIEMQRLRAELELAIKTISYVSLHVTK